MKHFFTKKTALESVKTGKGLLLLALLGLTLLKPAVLLAQCGVDISIANDQSGSVDSKENSQGRTFIVNLAQSLNLGNASNQSRMGISTWASTNTWSEYSFPVAGQNYTTQLSDIIAYKNSIRTLSGNTNPYDALQKTYNIVNQGPVVGRNAPKIVILMTDAYCSQIQSGITTLASNIKASGVYVMVLAIDAAASCNILKGTNVASPGMYFSGVNYQDLETNAIAKIQAMAAAFCTATSAYDLTINLTADNCATGAASYTVKNIGGLPFNGTVNVSFYDGDPSLPTTKLLASTMHPGQSIPINGSISLSYTNAAFIGKAKLYAVVNINPALATPPLPFNLINRLAISGEGAGNNVSGAFSATGCAVNTPRLEVTKTAAPVSCDKKVTYYVAIRHRSHLGAMTRYAQSSAQLQVLTDLSDTATKVFDFGTGHNAFDYTGLATNNNVHAGYRALWGGDFSADGKVKYDSPNDDQTTLLNEVLFYPANSSFLSNYDFAYGYFQGDFDMNSKDKYDSPGDDQTYLLNTVLFYPDNSAFLTNYDFFLQQLP